jgi:hypothetical protein
MKRNSKIIFYFCVPRKWNTVHFSDFDFIALNGNFYWWSTLSQPDFIETLGSYTHLTYRTWDCTAGFACGFNCYFTNYALRPFCLINYLAFPVWQDLYLKKWSHFSTKRESKLDGDAHNPFNAIKYYDSILKITKARHLENHQSSNFNKWVKVI